MTEYPDDDPDYYYVRVLQYNTSSQLWLIRGFEIDAECGEENANVTALYAREFRYDGDRARYAVIDRDPDDMEPTGATWHEYVGDNVYKDLSISSASGAVTVDASYSHGRVALSDNLPCATALRAVSSAAGDARGLPCAPGAEWAPFPPHSASAG